MREVLWLITRCFMSTVLNLTIDINSLTVSLTKWDVEMNYMVYSSAVLNATPFQVMTAIQSVPQELQISTCLWISYLFSWILVIVLVSELALVHIWICWGIPICSFGLRITVRLWCCYTLWKDHELHIDDYLR